ncbi:hypothetical protein DPEC_G00040400 [Dallia pectoralis]|uniref:Uncharacterized protein n=1 Tax=Dallia pectoralis TaxID=75939 RepID=A0ACC2HFK4_DALPE|nr:hypothetical protein DPEC_G00040400 [Dallia pectoralis]
MRDDDAVYLAGLGTVGMEIYEQVPKLDAVIIPAGGQCSLLVSTAAAIKHLNSRITVISLKTGSPVTNDLYSMPNKNLYGDLFEHSLGIETFQLAKKCVDKIISVREEDSLVAMLRFQEFEHSTVDTEGAMGLAAILAGQLPELKGKRVAVVVSSANMDLDLIRQCVDRALVLDDRVNKFTVQLGEFPGDMAKLLDVLARDDIKLLDVCHRRHGNTGDLFKAQVECVVETRDKTQSIQLRRTLSERYPTLRWAFKPSLVKTAQHIFGAQLPAIKDSQHKWITDSLSDRKHCTSSHPSVKILNFVDDTTLIGLISGGDESDYRLEADNLTVEMVVDFRRNSAPLSPITLCGSPVNTVESFCFLGTTL